MTALSEQARRLAMIDMIACSDYDPGWNDLTRPKRGTIKRFAAVSSYNDGRPHNVELYDTLEDALLGFEQHVGDDYPLSVIDLDNGDEHEVKVAVAVSHSNDACWELDTYPCGGCGEIVADGIACHGGAGCDE